MRLPALTTLLCALLVQLPSHAAPPAFTAVYEISRGAITLGEMTRTLQLDDDGGYVFESVMRSRGLVALFADDEVVEVSRGHVVGGVLRPEHYRYDKDGERKDFELSFDYPSNTVSRSDPARAWSADMPPRLQDKLSYQAQMMTDLDGAPGRLEYAIADRHKLKQYHITVLEPETIETGVGRFEAVRLRREKEGSKRRTTVWCAEALDWIPVRVEYRDKKGGVTEALLKSLQRGPAMTARQ